MVPDVVRAEWADAHIAVLDDEEPIRRLLAQVLAASGYSGVRTFADPVEALAELREFAPDLLLLDLHMPHADGTTVLRRLADEPSDERPAVIVMTGAGRTEDARRTLALGAADFLHKPVDTTELLLRVRHHLRERRLRRDLATHNERLEELVAERAGELALLSRVLDDIPIPAAVFTRDLALRYANARAQRLFALTGADALVALTDDAVGHDEVVAFLQGIADGGGSRLRTRVSDGSSRHRVELEGQRIGTDLVAVIVHDIEDQELTNDMLRRALEREQQANEELRAVEELRTSFLTAVSHELRTPLTVVLGMSESLHRHQDRIEPDRRRELLGRLHRNAERLKALLEDLLDLNRLAAGQLSVTAAPNDLAQIVRDAVEEIDAVDHEIDLDLVRVDVRVEAAQIRRAVANLIRNATVHTPAGTRIRVAIELDDDHARLVVADDGPGVPDPLKERIFAPFEQGPSAPRHRPGTGIGLSLVAEFTRLHGGRAWVEDTPGGGATFVIELPRNQSA